MSTAARSSRRSFLIRTGTGALALGAATALGGLACGGKDGGKKPAGDGLSCMSTAAIPGADRIKRKKAEYTDVSPHADKNCLNCQLYTPPNVKGSCGGCTSFAGGVHPKGYCTEWKAKEAAPG